MPQIRPITDLRNTTEISNLCHAKNEPIFITKNGEGDLVVMSIEAFEMRQQLLELRYSILKAEERRLNGAPGKSLEEFKEDLRNKRHALSD